MKSGALRALLNPLQFDHSTLELRERLHPGIHRVFVLRKESAKPEVADAGFYCQAIARVTSAINQDLCSAP